VSFGGFKNPKTKKVKEKTHQLKIDENIQKGKIQNKTWVFHGKKGGGGRRSSQGPKQGSWCQQEKGRGGKGEGKVVN